MSGMLQTDDPNFQFASQALCRKVHKAAPDASARNEGQKWVHSRRE